MLALWKRARLERLSVKIALQFPALRLHLPVGKPSRHGGDADDQE